MGSALPCLWDKESVLSIEWRSHDLWLYFSRGFNLSLSVGWECFSWLQVWPLWGGVRLRLKVALHPRSPSYMSWLWMLFQTIPEGLRLAALKRPWDIIEFPHFTQAHSGGQGTYPKLYSKWQFWSLSVIIQLFSVLMWFKALSLRSWARWRLWGEGGVWASRTLSSSSSSRINHSQDAGLW